MVILHIVLALSSLALASFNFFKPSSLKLETSYGLAIGTLLSGVALIFINNASVLRTCLTGIIFFAVVTILNQAANHKLSAAESRD